MSPAASLAGRVRLSPGRPLPTVLSSRPELAPRLARGRRAGELPALLGAVFTLCAHAQRFTAQRAVDAALGRPAPASADECLALQAATAREHCLRIAVDWPRQLGGPAPVWSENPLWRHTESLPDRLAALPGWLAQHLLGMAPAAWLARQDADPEGWAAAWCRDPGGSPLARLLRQQHDAAQTPAPSHPLALLRDPSATMPELARQLADSPDFCALPGWQGEPCDTGPWTRIHERPGRPAHNAWMRLVSRLTDLLRLALPEGGSWLAHGALALGPGEGIAWTEMARGLLVHWVRLDGKADEARVADCRVLAPTEWNFHPRGALARALSTLKGPGTDARTRCLAVAFDPCVEFEIEPESAHA